MNLREFMNEKALTIEKLAELSNVSASTIKRALKGNNLDATSMKRLASALGVSENQFKALLNEPSKPDYISELVIQQLNTLKQLDLEFEPSSKQHDIPVYRCIEQDISGDLSYLPKEFKKQVNKANNKKQLDALKELVLYCTTYLLDRSIDIDFNKTSFVSLRGGDNAWELRLFINAKTEQIEGLKFELIHCSNTGIQTLEPVKGAYPYGLSASSDPMDILLGIAKKINDKEQLTTKICPDQLRKGNSEDLKTFKEYCVDLNSFLEVLQKDPNNVFIYDETQIPNNLVELLAEYLPALRIMIIKVDDAAPFLVSGYKIHAVLTYLLKLVAKREKELFGSVVNEEVNNMSGSITINNFNGDVGTATVGNNNQITIGAKLNEIIPLLQEMQSMLAPNCPSESHEMQVLDEAINANPQAPQDAIKKIDNALQTAKKLVRQGTRLAELYNKVDALFHQLPTLL